MADPASGVMSPSSIRASVVLPLPDSPDEAERLAALDVKVHSGQGLHRLAA